MNIVTSIREMQRIADEARCSGERIGFVPTMGFLHEGHMRLVDAARAAASMVVLSIFVNPTQFGPGEDFNRYPRNIERDLAMAEARGCQFVFLPSKEEMYTGEFQTTLEIKKLSAVLEGEFRPGHFTGVATVVAKLFHIVKPHLSVFGQKDAQQAVIIRRMVRDLNMDVEILVAPIVREPDGLAMSSRNTYLSADDRTEAIAISRALKNAEALVSGGTTEIDAICSAVTKDITRTGRITVDYVRVVDADTFDPIVTIDEGRTALVAVAARIGGTRLIDNTILTRNIEQ